MAAADARVSLERLGEFLAKDKELREIEDDQRRKWQTGTLPAKEKIAQILQKHGLTTTTTTSAEEEVGWVRPFPAFLYRCPLSSPQTTLVSWNSLPDPVKKRLDPQPSDANGVVEVPLVWLVPEEMAETVTSTTTTMMQRRPLGGNLTNKLKEYTRGTAGQTRPFRPGGMDDNNDNVQQQITPFTLPQDMERSQRVLDNDDVLSSWKDGSLLTAPPGVDFAIGLSWNDVHGGHDDHPIPKGSIHAPVEEENPTQLQSLEEEETSAPQQAVYRETVLWEQEILDDDSLFGDSSSSEEEEDDDDDSDDDDDDSNDDEEDGDHDGDAKEAVVEEEKTDDYPQGDSLDEVDVLLREFSAVGDATQRKRALPTDDDHSSNPLELAKIHEQIAQQKTARKSWAVTNLLPIADYNSWIPNPAMTFPFTLDGFQQQAVARLERSESIFVAAHTSAGKTVCAEYAISLCQQHCTRLVYTSPIKALSNQKFRDFGRKFGAENVGLVTGDMQLNVDDSTCLIMTTEILRSMLYRGADLIRDIEWVVFDEVHYVNDSERGVVWEEVIIMLPQYVNMIFLSATTPNTIEFSDWIGRTKRKPVHVIRTNYRPVPLSHNLWAGLALHKIMEGRSGFLDKGYKEASRALKPAKDQQRGQAQQKSRSTGSGSKQLAWQVQGSKSNWMSLIRYLDREGLTPSVVFSFSKRKCEEIANMLRSLDLNTASERSAVQGFSIQTVARLSPNDAVLPQVLMVCEMVKRGIGVHHGGLLPILKEMVEILFSRNLIKVLFATETFAMGVNMPARSVVFNSIRKHDGTQFRELEPGEYTQMAGRAGRRGLDKVGTVIMCCFGEVPPPLPVLRNMLTGSSIRLQSQFRLTYNMILNLLRVEDMSVEGMIKRSFSEFATQRALTANEYPKLLSRGEKTLAKLENQFKLEAASRLGAEDLEAYFDTCSELLTTNAELLDFVFNKTSGDGGETLVPGRILLLTAARKHGYVRTPAMVLRAPTMPTSSFGRSAPSNTRKNPSICLVLLPPSHVSTDAKGDGTTLKPGSLNYVGEAKRRHFAIYEVPFNEILLISSTKYKGDVNALFKDDMRTRGNRSAGHSMGSRDFGGSFQGMRASGRKKDDDDFFSRASSKKVAGGDPTEQAVSYLIEMEKKELNNELKALEMRNTVKQGSDVLEFRKHCTRMEETVLKMRNFISHHHPAIESHYATLERKETLRSKVNLLRHMLSNESLQLFPDFLQRKSVLRTLGYIDENESVCLKGRVACEVNTCEELVATEMVFEGVLNDLEPAEIVAALSSLVFQEKSTDEEFDAELPDTLVECCERMKSIAVNLGQLQKEHGLEVDPGEYCDASLKFGLVHVVYEWALGVPFSDICELTLVQEGSIVRCITRLDELCRDIRNCARVVGNPTLYRKMEASSTAIKRDIVFASSLYVS